MEANSRKPNVFKMSDMENVLTHFPKEVVANVFEHEDVKDFFQPGRLPDLVELLTRLVVPIGKRSFLVFKHNKYSTVATDNIAFFQVRNESTTITCLGKQEYSVNHSLEHIQNLVSDNQFFRLNRQYLINFNAIKEVEHYFDRKLIVHLVFPVPEKLLVSKEKVSSFLRWLENR